MRSRNFSSACNLTPNVSKTCKRSLILTWSFFPPLSYSTALIQSPIYMPLSYSIKLIFFRTVAMVISMVMMMGYHPLQKIYIAIRIASTQHTLFLIFPIYILAFLSSSDINLLIPSAFLLIIIFSSIFRINCLNVNINYSTQMQE